jgi:transposase
VSSDEFRRHRFAGVENGARVGDIYMSLIHTCELCGASPLDYLVALKHHADQVAAAPHRWMPWNCEDALATR